MIQQSPTAIHHHQFSSQNITKLIQNPSVPVSNTPLKASTNPWGFAPWQLRGPLSSLQARLARQKLMVFVHPLPAWSGEEIWPKFLFNLFKEKDGRFVCHYQLLDVRFFFWIPGIFFIFLLGVGGLGGDSNRPLPLLLRLKCFSTTCILGKPNCLVASTRLLRWYLVVP